MLYAASAGTCWAQGVAAGFPAKPIRIMIALAPGGGVDTSARMIGQRFTDVWGQPVVAENRPGASGAIASELVARAAPDGYTLLMVSVAHAITPALYKLPYDTIKDFAPITLFAYSRSVLVVHPSLPVKNVKEFIAFVKARPNEILFSSSGTGTGQHLAMELLNQMAGLKLVHVPFKGTAASVVDLVGGRVSVTSASAISVMPHVRAGKLRALAIVSAKRSPTVPELPTIAESAIPGYAMDQWFALFAPGATPKEIVAKLYGEIARALAQPDVRERMQAMGLDPGGESPDEFATYLRAETAKYGKLVREAGIKAN